MCGQVCYYSTGFGNEDKSNTTNGGGENRSNTTNENVSVLEDMYKHLVYVTALSDNHFQEANYMFASVTNCFPNKEIIVYDLGLSVAHRDELVQQYHIQLRNFPFEEYSNLTYLKNLFLYGWKPIIVKEVSLEYDIIMYGDASVRMVSCNITPALEHLLQFPFFSGAPIFYRTIEFTHDGMIHYLKFPKSRTDMANIETFQGGCWLLLVNDESRKKIIDPWMDCAMHKECMAPTGSKRVPCNFAKTQNGDYVGCHRYDQSALNLILAREYGLDYFSSGSNLKISRSIFRIERIL